MPDHLTAAMSSQGETGTAAHCRRVALLATELSRQLRLTQDEQGVLTEAALLHHAPVELLENPSFQRLVSEVCGQTHDAGSRSPVPPPAPPPRVREVLHHLKSRPGPSAGNTAARLAAIVELCDFFDQRMEYAPYENTLTFNAADDLAEMARDGICPSDVAACFSRLNEVSSDELDRAVANLPVCPEVALSLLRLPSDEQTCFDELVTMASLDQALATHVLRAANSGIHSPRSRITSLNSAVAYIGVHEARRVMTAASLRPLFSSPALRSLWSHSLESAGISERLATLSGHVDFREAYLAGLVHDIGRLILHGLAPGQYQRYRLLVEGGAPPAFAEVVLFGADHGTFGAKGLARSKFPEELTTAIRYHHRPEKTSSPLASVLYLAEHWCNSEEDLPSAARLHHAIEHLGIEAKELDALDDGSTWNGSAGIA